MMLSLKDMNPSVENLNVLMVVDMSDYQGLAIHDTIRDCMEGNFQSIFAIRGIDDPALAKVVEATCEHHGLDSVCFCTTRDLPERFKKVKKWPKHVPVHLIADICSTNKGS